MWILAASHLNPLQFCCLLHCICQFYSLFMKMMALHGPQSPLGAPLECQANCCNFTRLPAFSHEAMVSPEILRLAAYEWNTVLERVRSACGVPGWMRTMRQCGSCSPLELHLFSRRLSIYRFPETHWGWGPTFPPSTYSMSTWGHFYDVSEACSTTLLLSEIYSGDF